MGATTVVFEEMNRVTIEYCRFCLASKNQKEEIGCMFRVRKDTADVLTHDDLESEELCK